MQSALPQVHSLFQNRFSRDRDLVLPLSNCNVISFPSGHSVAAYVFFIIVSSSPHLSLNKSFGSHQQTSRCYKCVRPKFVIQTALNSAPPKSHKDWLKFYEAHLICMAKYVGMCWWYRFPYNPALQNIFCCWKTDDLSADNELAGLLHVHKGPQFNPVLSHFNAELRRVPSG